jgi:hypothetical protein
VALVLMVLLVGHQTLLAQRRVMAQEVLVVLVLVLLVAQELPTMVAMVAMDFQVQLLVRRSLVAVAVAVAVQALVVTAELEVADRVHLVAQQTQQQAQQTRAVAVVDNGLLLSLNQVVAESLSSDTQTHTL